VIPRGVTPTTKTTLCNIFPKVDGKNICADCYFAKVKLLYQLQLVRGQGSGSVIFPSPNRQHRSRYTAATGDRETGGRRQETLGGRSKDRDRRQGDRTGAGDRRQETETEDRRQETGDRRQETGDRRQGDRRQDRRQRQGDRETGEPPISPSPLPPPSAPLLPHLPAPSPISPASSPHLTISQSLLHPYSL